MCRVFIIDFFFLHLVFPLLNVCKLESNFRSGNDCRFAIEPVIPHNEPLGKGWFCVGVLGVGYFYKLVFCLQSNAEGPFNKEEVVRKVSIRNKDP